MRLALVASVLLLGCLAMASDRVVLHSRSSTPRGWTVKGPAPTNKLVTFIVAVKQQNLDVLDKVFWEVSTPGSPKYRDFLSIDQINSIVAPRKEDMNIVNGWLKSAGVKSARVLGDAVEATATVAVASQMFETTFQVFEHTSGRLIVRQFGPYSVPSAVRNVIDLVSGLSEFPVEKPTPKTSPNANAATVPQTINSVYSTPSNHSADSKSSEGVIEFEGQSFSPSDLQSFATSMAIKIPALTSDHIVGPNQPSGPGTEAELDIQYIAAVGRGSQNWFWLESGEAWLYGFATHFFNTADVPHIASISYGWAEADQCQQGIGGSECQQLGVDSEQYVKRVNTEFQKIGAKGVSLIAASGDSGANGRTDGLCTETHLNPTFPAASPYITAVGATQLNNAETNLPNPPPACQQFSCASGGDEVAVSYDVAHFASGGGFSNFADTPAYQKDAVSAYLNGGTALPPSSYFNSTGRGYPDVAAFGNDVLVNVGGNLEGVGGTSCSSPIFAGVVSLLNDISISKSGKPLGFLNPLLYKMPADAFNDITTGDNKCTEDGCGSCKGYVCAKGWDPITGRGSPNFPKMKAYVENL